MAKAPTRKTSRKQKKKPAVSGLKKQIQKWSSTDVLHSPKFQIATTCAVVLICLYIAVTVSIFHTSEDDTILEQDISWETVFTQKTLRSARLKMELKESDMIYLYAPPTATVDSNGTITDFVFSLAVPEKERYSLWEMKYYPAESTLYLQMTEKKQRQKDLAVSLEQLPPIEEVLKTFLLFPGKYMSQIFPLPAGGVYQFAPATDFAVMDYDFSAELSKGTPGVWISSSGGGSMIDASFHPTGKYLTYNCTLLEISPSSAQSSSKNSNSSQPSVNPKDSRAKVLVMTELSAGNGIL
jgi:hypothetical protein